jgi:hypothetical protein
MDAIPLVMMLSSVTFGMVAFVNRVTEPDHTT